MIHTTAVIEPGAELGQSVSVGPFSYIAAGSFVGDECVIGPNVTILGGTTLGSRCEVHSGAVLGDTPQDRDFEDGDSRVVVGQDCIIREGVTLHRGSKPGTATEIGDGCFLMGFSHCAHNVRLGKQVIVANGAVLAGYVEVGERAFISGNVSIHQFTKIGRVVMLGGGCGVSKDVPPFCTVRPASLNTITGLNTVGLRRAGISAEDRALIKQAFKVLYRSGLNTSQAVERLAAEFTTGPASEFAGFIAGSERGICPPAVSR